MMFRHTTQVSVLFLAALLGAFGLQRSTDAAQLSMTNNGAIYTFYVDGEALNGGFETIYFQAKATPPGKFANVTLSSPSGVPRPPGHAFTYQNRMLTQDPLDFPGALRLMQVGLILTGQELSYGR